MDVAIQKRAYVFVGRRDFMLVQDTDDNARIGHACDLDFLQIVSDTEALLKGSFERLNTRASRIDQRPVDVETQEASCNCGLHLCSCAMRATRFGCDCVYAA